MKYQCQNCGWAFTQPAEITKAMDKEGSVALHVSGMLVISNTIKTFACPRCNSIAYEETEQNKTPANVYVYELTTGPQTKLDELLAEGYEVVNRYSKQYHLEKPKVAPKDANFENLCPQIQTCTHEKEARALKLEPNVPLPCDNKGEGCAYHMTAEAKP